MIRYFGERIAYGALGGTYYGAEAVAKVTSLAHINKFSWGILFAQTVIPAVNGAFFHDAIASGFHIDKNILMPVDIAAGSIAGLNAAANGYKGFLEWAFDASGKRADKRLSRTSRR